MKRRPPVYIDMHSEYIIYISSEYVIILLLGLISYILICAMK